MHTETEYRFLNEVEWLQAGAQLLSQAETWIPLVNRRLAEAPEGRLVIGYSNGMVQYFLINNGKKTYIPVDQMDMIKKLAQKGYDAKALSVLKKWPAREKHVRKWIEETTLTELYENMSPERRKLVTPLVCSPQEFVEEWLAEEYEGLGFQENEPEFYAVDGTRVRSKSERDTVDELIEFSVPYKYEKPLQLKGFGVVHPDFCVLNRRTGQEFVWEHFGMMDDRSYAVDNIRKLEAYHYNGFFEGVNFISTWETRRTPFGRRDARRVIEQYLL